MHPLSAAAASVASKLEVDAATENADAFNDEFEAETHVLFTKSERETRLYVLPLKIWDATLDRRTCPVCEEHDGTVVPWGLSFPQRLPAHPRCRCRVATLFLSTPTTEAPEYNFQ